MRKLEKTSRLIAALSIAGLAACSEPAQEQSAVEEVSVEVVAVPSEPLPLYADAEVLAGACDEAYASLERGFQNLETADAPKTVDGYLTQYDDFSRQSYWAMVPFYFHSIVHPDTDVRESGMTCYQRLTEIPVKASLSRPIYDAAGQIDVSEEDVPTRRFMEELLRDFKLSGVDKDEETRKEIATLIDEMIEVGQAFDKVLRDDVRYAYVDSAEGLAGLPEDYIASHPAGEDGRIAISTRYPDYFPVMKYAENDDLRRDLRVAALQRGYPANVANLANLLEKRQELATILGFENHAELSMIDYMIGNPERAQTFIDDVSAAARPAGEAELSMLLARARQIDPEAEKVNPWQISYLSEKVRQELFDFSSADAREYFPYQMIKSGIFDLTQEMFQVEFRKWEAPVWHESVEAYEVLEGGKVIGQFYLDMHPRKGKGQHASHYTLRIGIDGKQLPLSALVTNFPGGDGGPGLMEHGDALTFFHEFGHLLHNMFSGTQGWHDISGMDMERDFVEAPSQMLEEWFWDLEVLQRIARNQDGEPIPADLVAKMNQARNFGEGLGTSGQMTLAAMSLAYHLADAETLDLVGVEKEIMEKYSLFGYTGGVYRFASFGHLNGYSSNYYQYMWSQTIADDLFTRFKADGLTNQATARAYRDSILASGGSRPVDEAIEEFLGRPFTVDAFMKKLTNATEVNRQLADQ